MEIFQKQETKTFVGVLVVCLAVFLIIFNFTNTPAVWVDEGVFTNVAQSLYANGSVGLQTAPSVSFPLGLLLSNGYPVIYPISWTFHLFGVGLWQSRLVMILYMFALAGLFFLFSKKLYGFYPAILSTLFLLSFSPFYGNGRPVQGEVPGLVFLVLGALMLLYWERSRFQNKYWLALAGLSLGLSASVKPLYLLIIGATALVTFAVWFKKIEHKKNLFYFLLGSVPPAIAWFLYQFNGEHTTGGVIRTYLSFAAYFAGNHGSSVGVLQTITTNLLRFFTETTPMLFLGILIIVSVSFGLRYFKKDSREISISEFFIMLFMVLNFLGYLNGTGWYRYFFPASVLAYLLFPAAIFTFTKMQKNILYKKVIFSIPILLLIFQLYHLIFLSDTSFVVKRIRNTEMQTALSKLDTSKKILFYNTGETIIFLKNNNYYQYLSMEGFLNVGDKNSINDKSFDYMIVNETDDVSSIASCYRQEKVSRYILLTKNTTCKK